jgi:hypothetical protein
MIPHIGQQDLSVLTTETIPTRTYRLDLDRGIISGMTHGLEAIKQAIYLILSTERFIYPIYSWNYGVEIWGLMGRNRFYVEAELERRITDALMQDDRILSVGGFTFAQKKHTMQVKFSVETTAGTAEITQEMRYV